MISIDPGEVHCGTALWLDGVCYEVKEYKPVDLFRQLGFWFRGQAIDVVVYEGFFLYPWLMKEQGFSQMETCEAIGVIKYLCNEYGVKIVEQKATIKVPTRAQMKARKVDNLAVTQGKGGHCADAVLHGFYYLSYGITREEK